MKRRRIVRVLCLVLAGIIVTVAIGGVILSRYARRTLDAKLVSAGISIESLHINLFTRSVNVSGFEWKPPADSVSHRVSVKLIHASGIDIISLIRRKEIHLGTLSLSGGDVIIDHAVHTDKPRANPGLPINDITVGRLSLNAIKVTVINDSTTEHAGTVDLVLREVTLHEPGRLLDINAYSIGDLELNVNGYRMNTKKSMYTLSLARVNINSSSGDISVDSIVLIPKHSKYRFSRLVGKQVDRFVLRIPQVSLSGVDFSRIKDSVFTVSSLAIKQANLHVFRDKRLPFIKHHNMPLPVAMIRGLPFEFAVDSLTITDTRITYEEFPEQGFETGYIVFNQLNASLGHISNRDHYPGEKEAVLRVTSRVMQNGVINVDFSLPYDKAQVYNAKGRISNLALDRLNPILESLAFVRVEKGRLNALDFDFDYDDYSSAGSILINYENLQLTGLKKEKGARKNDVKSLALGMFVRKDKDSNVSIERRRGKVSYERDRRRAIFNIWVRSLMSGVKSSVVDAPAKRTPLSRKERRDSLRNVRKEIRKEKRADREQNTNENTKAPKNDSTVVIASPEIKS